MNDEAARVGTDSEGRRVKYSSFAGITRTAEAEAIKRDGPRTIHGEGHPNSKLNEELVREICQLHYQEGMEPTEIATLDHIPVKRNACYKVVRGQTWAHIHIPCRDDT